MSTIHHCTLHVALYTAIGSALQSAENRVHCSVMPAAMCRTVRGTVLHDIHCTWRCTVHYYWQCSVLATVLLQSGVGRVGEKGKVRALIQAAEQSEAEDSPEKEEEKIGWKCKKGNFLSLTESAVFK